MSAFAEPNFAALSVTAMGGCIETVTADRVVDLLTLCGLQTHDLIATMPTRWWGVRVDGMWVACVGLETQGGVGWLRSLAVLPPWRGRGLASVLCRHLEVWAEQGGLSAVYLLTTQAQPWFAARGYKAMPRAQAPEVLNGFRQFVDTCPAHATLMSRALTQANQATCTSPGSAARPAHAGAWRLAVGHALQLNPSVPRSLLLVRGRAWVTLDQGPDTPDRVLVAGDRLDVPPGSRLVMEPWPQGPEDTDPVLFDWAEVPPPARATSACRVQLSRFQRQVATPLRDAWQAGRAAAAGARLAVAAGIRAGWGLACATWGLLSYADWLVAGRGEPTMCGDWRRL